MSDPTRADATHAHPPEPDPVADTTPGHTDQGLFVGARVQPHGRFKVASLGYARSGKTTYLGMLYALLCAGALPRYRFAWSDSLRELEDLRGQLHRDLTEGGPAFPPRTPSDAPTYLHLGLRHRADQRYVDLYLPESSGEDQGRVFTEGAFPEPLHPLANFDGYLLFVDATSITPLLAGRYLRLISGLLELRGEPRLDAPLAVLLSKWDLLPDPPADPDAFFRERFGGLFDAWNGRVSAFRVFPLSSVGRSRTLTGHDGLPIERDGAPVLVPDPTRLPDDTFQYQPLNLSLPLLWVLEKLRRQSPPESPS